jgi:hypothetical protein
VVAAAPVFGGALAALKFGGVLTSDRVANAIVVGVFLTVLSSLGGAATGTVFGVLAVASCGFVYRSAPAAKGRQPGDIRHFRESGGKWPAKPSVEPTCR